MFTFLGVTHPQANGKVAPADALSYDFQFETTNGQLYVRLGRDRFVEHVAACLAGLRDNQDLAGEVHDALKKVHSFVEEQA